MALGRAKTGLFYITLAAAAMLLMFLAAAQQRGTGFADSGLRGGDRALIELTLERYRDLARNVTQRLETVERTVVELRAAQQHRPPPKAAAPAAQGDTTTPAETAEKPDATAETDAAPDPPFQFPNDEDPDETDEERAARQEAEEKLQKTLIHFEESTKKFRRFRGDFKCGSRVPLLPDGEVVECTPGFDAPCCSALGWCGRSAEHCKCEMCSDYRSKVKITMKRFKLQKAKRECETISADLGEFTSPEDCAHVALQDAECGKMIMYSWNYPNWGCRCCAPDTPAASEEKAEWNVYAFEVKEEPVKEA